MYKLLKVFISDILEIGSNNYSASNFEFVMLKALICFLEYREDPNFSTSDKGTRGRLALVYKK